MIKIRRSSDRGHANHGWLDTHHTFSFASYYDPEFMGFYDLRVINEDRVAPGQGFGTHAHADMEILSYIIDGTLQHKDSMGTGSLIRAGELQRMSAGSGVTHSEFNASPDKAVHFLQIWILPRKNGIVPSYEQRHFSLESTKNQLQLLASPDGSASSVTLHQDVWLWGGAFEAGQSMNRKIHQPSWIQVIDGKLTVNDHQMEAGDGAAIDPEGEILLNIQVENATRLLWFDLKR